MRPVDPYRANHFNILGIYMKSKKERPANKSQVEISDF